MPIRLTDSARWTALVHNRVYITDVDPDVIVANGSVRIVGGALARAVIAALADGSGVMLAGGATVVGIGALGAAGGSAVGGSSAVAMLMAATDGDMLVTIFSGGTARAVLEAIAQIGGGAYSAGSSVAGILGLGKPLSTIVGGSYSSTLLNGIAAIGASQQGATQARAIFSGTAQTQARATGGSLARAIVESAAGGWVPSDVTGLHLWLAADALTGLSNGDPLTTWTDISSLNRHATQGTTSQKPTYRTNIVNGLPIIRFDGADDWMACDGVSAAFTGDDTPHTVAIIAKRAAVNDFHCMISGYASTTIQPVLRYQMENTNAVKAGRRGDSGVETSQTASSVGTAWEAFVFVFSGTTISIWRNSTQIMNGLSLNVVSINLPNIALGCWANGGSRYSFFHGDIAEIVVYNHALDATNRESLRSYLATKYGL